MALRDVVVRSVFMSVDNSLAGEVVYGIFTALAIILVFVLQALAFFMAGFFLGKKSVPDSPRRGGTRYQPPVPLPANEVNEPVIGGEPLDVPDYEVHHIGFGLPHPPPPPPVEGIPRRVPPPEQPGIRQRRMPRMARTEILDDWQAELPSNRFPEVVFWTDNGGCFHTKRNCRSIGRAPMAYRARQCTYCRPGPEDFPNYNPNYGVRAEVVH